MDDGTLCTVATCLDTLRVITPINDANMWGTLANTRKYFLGWT